MSQSLAARLRGSTVGGVISASEQFTSLGRGPDWLGVVAPVSNHCLRSAAPDTGIVIVNWNSWPETIEALEAVFRMQGFDGPVIVCDNASVDGSLGYIKQWAEGTLCALPESYEREIRNLVIPPVEKNFQVAELSCGEVNTCVLSPEVAGSRLWLVSSAENGGFGAGSNIGIRLLLRMPKINNFWLLNCDALPAQRAYRELKNEMPALLQPIICGSALLEYWKPSVVQSCGAKFNPLLCSMSDNLKGMPSAALQKMENVHHVHYPVGASIVVNREFLDSVGFMSEDYFLYFEELDWVARLPQPGKAFVVASSLVYHKGGATTGAGSTFKDRALKTDYYFLRSRVIFACRHMHGGMLVALASAVIAVLRRLLYGNKGVARNAMLAILDGFRQDTRGGE
ncbi:MAG: GT2 family glycosyltransferase [Paracoccaceae bacterium]|jgi:GT2 family glycosyltransferase